MGCIYTVLGKNKTFRNNNEIPYCDTRENVCACACVSGQYLQQASSVQTDDYSSDLAQRPHYTNSLMELNNDRMSGLRLGYWFRCRLLQGIRQKHTARFCVIATQWD